MLDRSIDSLKITGRVSENLIGTAIVRAPGHCGELAQGVLGDNYFLVTCPVDFYARVQVELFDDGPGIDAPPDCSKAAAAVTATLSHWGQENLAARLTINNPIPRSKGMGSSSADVAAAIAATSLALGRQLTPNTIGKIALSIEPTDGIMFPGISIFDHREGRISEVIGSAPPMEIIALDFGGMVDTLEFNRVDRRSAWQAIEPDSLEALRLVRKGIEQGNPELVGQGASLSAIASQQILPKPQLSEVIEFARSVGAVGVNVAHSGTIIGILIDARPRRGKSTFHKARQAFPQAESAHHFRLLGGGLIPLNSAQSS